MFEFKKKTNMSKHKCKLLINLKKINLNKTIHYYLLFYVFQTYFISAPIL